MTPPSWLSWPSRIESSRSNADAVISLRGPAAPRPGVSFVRILLGLRANLEVLFRARYLGRGSSGSPAMPLWRAALAVRRMVQNIKEPNKLWPPGTTVRVLSNDAEPDLVAAMVAEFADQMSKTTTASALEWTNSVLANEEAASGRVAAGRAIEVNYAGPRKVVDLKISPGFVHSRTAQRSSAMELSIRCYCWGE